MIDSNNIRKVSKAGEKLAEAYFNCYMKILKRRIDKMECNRTFASKIVGINCCFDGYEIEKGLTFDLQDYLIAKYNVPYEPERKGNYYQYYYTIKIMGEYYMVPSQKYFEMGDKVWATVERNNWSSITLYYREY